MIRPLRDRILVQRLEGHGIERTTPGGIIIPATAEKGVATKPDYYRARVEALGPEARLGDDLVVGDHVLVYTYAGTAEQTFTGDELEGRRVIVGLDDILCVVERTAEEMLADA